MLQVSSNLVTLFREKFATDHSGFFGLSYFVTCILIFREKIRWGLYLLKFQFHGRCRCLTPLWPSLPDGRIAWKKGPEEGRDRGI